MTYYQIAPVAPRAELNLGLLKQPRGQAIEPHTVTIGASSGSNILLEAKLGQQPVFRNIVSVTGIEGNRLLVPAAGLSGYDSYAQGYLDGAELRVLRCTADGIAEIATRRVISTRLSWRFAFKADGTGPMLIDGTTLSWRPDSWVLAGQSFHVRVRAVTADGRAGPWSNVVTYQPGARSAAVAPVATFVAGSKASADAYPADAAVPAPVLSVQTAADQTGAFSWTPAAGCRYLAEYSYLPDFPALSCLDLDDASGLRADDLFIVTKAVPFGGKHGFYSPRMAGVYVDNGSMARGPRFAEDLPPGASVAYLTEGARDFARIAVPAGKSLRMELYPHGGLATDWYPVLWPDRRYRALVRGRVQTPVTVTVGVNGAAAKGDLALPLALGTAWADHTVDFAPQRAPYDDAIPRSASFNIVGPQVLDLELFTFFEVEEGAKVGDMTQRMAAEFLASGAGYVRQHGGVKRRPWGLTARSYLLGNPTGSLPLWLEQAAGARAANGGEWFDPWLQLPGGFNDDEIAAVAEYMCTPYDPAVDTPVAKPWAALRHSQGHTRPWQEVFGQIRAEWENENWNTIAAFWTLPRVSGYSAGFVNGKMLDRMARIFAANPHYRPEKWNWYLGLWAASGWGAGSWNGDGVAASGAADFAGYADYNGGWDSGSTAASRADSPKAVFGALANSNVAALGRSTRAENAAALVARLAATSDGRAKPIRAAYYESGPGYNLNGLNGVAVTPADMAQQSLLMTSVGVGTATLDAFCASAAAGVVSNDFFTFGRGSTFNSHSYQGRGEAAIPAFQWLGFANRELIGEIAALPLTNGVALVIPADVTGMRSDAGDTVKLYRVRRPDGTTAIALCNVSPTDAQTVTLLKRAGGTWTRHWMEGPHTRSNGQMATRDSVSILAEPAPGWSDSQITLTLGAGLTEVFTEAPAA